MSAPEVLLHTSPLAVGNIILEHLCDLLESLNVPTVRCCYGQGEIPPMDDCCIVLGGEGVADRNGYGWVTIGPVFPTGNFPAPAEAVQVCPTGLAQQYTVGVYRCAPTVDDKGRPPTCEQITEAVERQTRDGVIVRQAVRCSLEAADRTYVMQQGAPINPRGGCMGWSQQVLVHVADCLACTPIES